MVEKDNPDTNTGTKEPTPTENTPLVRSKTARWLLISAGSTSLGLGILGAALPVLPTTPFLLLSAYCFGKSSPKLLHWLLTNEVFGRYLQNYREHRGIPGRVKVYILIMLWTTILCSAFLATQMWWLRIFLIATAIGVTLHILRIKTAQTASEKETTRNK